MSAASGEYPVKPQREPAQRSHLIRWPVLALVLLLLACVAWIGIRAVLAERHLKTAVSLAAMVEHQVAGGNSAGAEATAKRLVSNADASHRLTSDPIWRAAEILPLVGTDLRAVRQISAVLSNVSTDAILPVTRVAGTLTVAQFKPVDGAIDLQPLTAAQPTLRRAATDLRQQLLVARNIDSSDTVAQIDSAVNQLVAVLAEASKSAAEADHALTLLPQMLGSSGPRNYLILFQNNAEVRSTGGIPGALAEIHAQGGRITLTRQASTADFSHLATPAVKLPTETEGIYGSITGEFVQDVTLTPRFDLSAKIAQAMWKRKYGTTVDGVLSIDPVALGYLVAATGPITLPTGETLTSQNTVSTLLSNSYAKYPLPAEQDAFFAGAAKSVFDKIASGSFDPPAFLTALTHATDEHRLLLWSARPTEQGVIRTTALSGALPISTAGMPKFGVYFNDSTGAKMDYYLKTQVSVGQKVCRTDGRPTLIVEVTLTNTVPTNAASTLTPYVTGGGDFGVAPGDLQTTVSVYAPKTGVFIGASQDGLSRSVHNALDGSFPVAQYETSLSPGKTTSWRIEFLGAPAATITPGVIVTPTIGASEAKKVLISCKSPLS